MIALACVLFAALIAPVEPKAALVLVARGKAVLIDVREAGEIAQGLPAPAVWLPLSRIEREPNLLLQAIPAKRGAVFCCGDAAWAAAKRIVEMRKPLLVLGEFEKWRALGLPVRLVPLYPLSLAGEQ